MTEPAAPTPSAEIRIRLFGRTDVGQIREHNEDNFLIADLTRRSRSLMEADREQLVSGFQPVEIEVENRQPPAPVLMHQCEGRAGHLPGETKPPGQSFAKMCLARSQTAGQRQHSAGFQSGGESFAQCHHFQLVRGGPLHDGCKKRIGAPASISKNSLAGFADPW